MGAESCLPIRTRVAINIRRRRCLSRGWRLRSLDAFCYTPILIGPRQQAGRGAQRRAAARRGVFGALALLFLRRSEWRMRRTPYGKDKIGEQDQEQNAA